MHNLTNLIQQQKNVTKVTLRLSSNIFVTDETSFLPKFIATDSQVSSLRKAFANNVPANMKLSKAQLSEIIHSGWLFLGRLLGTLMKVYH